jgi:hypothetical protein
MVLAQTSVPPPASPPCLYVCICMCVRVCVCVCMCVYVCVCVNYVCVVPPAVMRSILPIRALAASNCTAAAIERSQWLCSDCYVMMQSDVYAIKGRGIYSQLHR